jgi:hypothetical protein
MTKLELADRLARIALGHCAHDSDPDIDEECVLDRKILVRKFLKELNSYEGRGKK